MSLLAINSAILVAVILVVAMIGDIVVHQR
jgi:hypothetical protein